MKFLFAIKICPKFLVNFSFLKLSAFINLAPPPLFGKFPASKNLNFLTVVIWNASGLIRQASEFRDFIADNNLDIMLVLETKFHGNFVRFANCVLFNANRQPTVGCRLIGGTAVYDINGLNATLS